MDTATFRTHFPAVIDQTYADAAAIGPLSKDALVETTTFATDLSTRGSAVIPEMLGRVQRCRNRVAQLLGCTADDLGFTDCTSTSMSLLAQMARHDAGGRSRFVTLRDEFPSTTLPWLAQGFQARWVEPGASGGYAVDTILDAVTADTRAVVLSQVQYRTGARTDVAALARELAGGDVWLVVNATQAAGVVPQDVQGHTATTVTGLKWLCGGFGNGILHLSPALRETTPWPVQGWIGQRDFMAMRNDRLDPLPTAAAVELGGTGMARLYTLDASVGLLLMVGAEALQAHTLALTARLREGLEAQGACLITPRPDHLRAGILSALRSDAEAWHAWALSAGIVQSLRGPGTIRFALHGYNDESDVDRLIEAWRTHPEG